MSFLYESWMASYLMFDRQLKVAMFKLYPGYWKRGQMHTRKIGFDRNLDRSSTSLCFCSRINLKEGEGEKGAIEGKTKRINVRCRVLFLLSLKSSCPISSRNRLEYHLKWWSMTWERVFLQAQPQLNCAAPPLCFFFFQFRCSLFVSDILKLLLVFLLHRF